MHRPIHVQRRPQRQRAGFSIVEVMLVLTVLTVGIGMFAGTLGSVMGLGPSLRESALAIEAARAVIESMRARPFDQVYALYNADPADDPLGPGTAPGAAFAMPGLSAVPGDADGLVGLIVFPEVGGELREDSADADLGMPRDLDLDGAVDGVDHAADYRVLPVLVRVEWRGKGPARRIDLHTTLTAP
jgi:type II secretory pathway pseudopilin PulG